MSERIDRAIAAFTRAAKLDDAEAQRLFRELRDAFEAAAERMGAHQWSIFVANLENGDLAAAQAVANIDPEVFARIMAPLDRIIGEAFYRGGLSALAALPRVRDPFPVGGPSSASRPAPRARNDG